MVVWTFCECGRVVDEFEEFCHWCGRPISKEEDYLLPAPTDDENQLRLF